MLKGFTLQGIHYQGITGQKCQVANKKKTFSSIMSYPWKSQENEVQIWRKILLNPK